HGGVVQQVGAPLELYDRPANLFVAGFIGSPGMNFLEGHYVTKDGHAAIRFADGTEVAVEERLSFAGDQKVTLGIRPEHVVIAPDGAIEATVDLIEPT
ncbi:MAG: glycerol-3-phosphate ABC transporter ATP-binding protein, partial [Allorhizobium sp.]